MLGPGDPRGRRRDKVEGKGGLGREGRLFKVRMRSAHGPARRVVAFMKINTPQLALVSIVHGRLRTIAHLETTTITK